MSAQALGAKRLRDIARAIDQPVRRGWAHGGTVFAFVTFHHEHGVWNSRTGEVQWGGGHYQPACTIMFPDDFPASIPEWGQAWAVPTCGETAELAVHSIAEPEARRNYDVVCELDPGHPKQHRCGSLSWARDGEGGI